MKIVKQTKKFRHDGDIDYVFGKGIEQYLLKDKLKNENEFSLRHLTYFTPVNPMNALGVMDIDNEVFIKSRYKDPYFNNLFYALAPYSLLTKDLKYWSKFLYSYQVDMFLDEEWNNGFINVEEKDEDDDIIVPNNIKILMGSGYTDFTRENDGSGYRTPVLCELENGDYLKCFVWIWYNK